MTLRMLLSCVQVLQSSGFPAFGVLAVSGLTMGGCSASPVEDAVAPAALDLSARVRTGDVFLASRVAANPDVSVWEDQTSTPSVVPDLGVTDWECELLMPEPVATGAWRLVDVAETYTPIMDIVADRTGLPVGGTNVYYVFRLHADEE